MRADVKEHHVGGAAAQKGVKFALTFFVFSEGAKSVQARRMTPN
jgi:hypothetical protein